MRDLSTDTNEQHFANVKQNGNTTHRICTATEARTDFSNARKWTHYATTSCRVNLRATRKSDTKKRKRKAGKGNSIKFAIQSDDKPRVYSVTRRAHNPQIYLKAGVHTDNLPSSVHNR